MGQTIRKKRRKRERADKAGSKAAPLKCKGGERLSLKGDRERKQKRESKGESGQEMAGSKVVPLEWHEGQRLRFTRSSWLASPICC